MSGRPIGPCPECGKMAIITLIPSRIETKSTHPNHCGNYGTYDEVIARTMTWNCSNKTCDQFIGKPNLAEYRERRNKAANEKMEKELAKYLNDNKGG